jgi:hypothetical protein
VRQAITDERDFLEDYEYAENGAEDCDYYAYDEGSLDEARLK